MMPLLAIASTQPSYELGDVVTQQLFIGDHITHAVSRGPFTSSRAWLATGIELYVKNALKILTDVTLDANDYDREAASNIMKIGMKLLRLFPKIFPSAKDEEKDSFILFNHDLDIQNILVNPDGRRAYRHHRLGMRSHLSPLVRMPTPQVSRWPYRKQLAR
jgi:hypothetical protein